MKGKVTLSLRIFRIDSHPRNIVGSTWSYFSSNWKNQNPRACSRATSRQSLVPNGMLVARGQLTACQWWLESGIHTWRHPGLRATRRLPEVSAPRPKVVPSPVLSTVQWWRWVGPRPTQHSRLPPLVYSPWREQPLEPGQARGQLTRVHSGWNQGSEHGNALAWHPPAPSRLPKVSAEIYFWWIKFDALMEEEVPSIQPGQMPHPGHGVWPTLPDFHVNLVPSWVFLFGAPHITYSNSCLFSYRLYPFIFGSFLIRPQRLNLSVTSSGTAFIIPFDRVPWVLTNEPVAF